MWERVEELMKEYGLRIVDIAKGCGISYSTLTDWKMGRYTPKRDKIEKIAEYLNVSPAYIMGKTDVKYSGKKEDMVVQQPDDEIRKTITETMESISDLVYEKMVQDHPEWAERDSLLAPYNTDELIKAIDLYELYQNASPAVRESVEILLKAQLPKP